MAQDGKLNKSLVLYFIVPFLLLLFIKFGVGYFNNNEDNSYQKLAISESLSGEAVRLPEKVDYIFHVKPILSDRCYLCHGPDDGTREAGLRLDTKEGAFAAIGENLDRHAIVSGDINTSQLVLKINHTDPDKLMPPITSNLSLTDYEKKILTKWIEQGAEWKEHWAFVPPTKKEIPKILNSVLANNEIDFFIIHQMEKVGLTPSAKAAKENLIRRASFDIRGLPPTLNEIDDFINDKNANAYEKVIDAFLATEAYGEKMTSHWLDVARYADTHGYQDDLERVMWPWRDWVIHAYNKNLPYDQFIKWQLAGDLLPNATLEQIVATGFNRNHKITQEGGVIDEEYRVEYVMDRANTTATALMGLTMECARCHDHKYDPISQKEFYGFYGFFNKVDEKGRIEYDEIPQPNLKITPKEIKESLTFIHMPDSVKKVELMVMKDDAPNRKTFLLKRGAYDAPAEEVSLGTPNIVLPFSNEFSQDRSGLADWFFDERNALTARVAVNRMWQQVFGRGIVATSADFGNQGALPSHPELLDWLAVTFREEGWDIKKMMKRMFLSNTYQQSSKITPELLEMDGENRYFARSSRNKLTSEMIRDNALAVSGLLVNKVGGPSVKPYQPEGLWEETTSGQGLTQYFMDTGENQYRRSLYTFWKRTVPPPSMMTFDGASRDFCAVERQKTSTPLQALVMLNDPQLMEAAQTLAYTMLNTETMSEEEMLIAIFRKLTSRFPDKTEQEKLTQFLRDAENDFNKTKEEKVKIVLKRYNNDTISPEKLYAFTVLTSLVINLDEAIIKG